MLSLTDLKIENFIGPCFLMTWLSLILYGLFLAQVYFYFTNYPDDLTANKATVILLCVLESLHVAACMHIMYTYLIVDFPNPGRILKIAWTAGVTIYLELIISGTVQMFYIWRIWCLSRRAPIAIYLVTMLCARLGVGFRSTAYLYTVGTWLDLAIATTYRRFALASFAISVVMDLSVTAAFSLSLNNNQVLAHTRNTKNIIHKLMNYALSTGILTAITSVTTLILFDVFKLQVHFGGTLMLLTKVYANSMLAMLNIRQGIKRGATLSTTNGFSVHLSNFPEQTLTPSTIKVEVAPSRASDMTIDA